LLVSKSAKGNRKESTNTRGLLILVGVSLIIVPLVYWLLSWQVAFVLLLLLPLIAYWLFIPTKFLRLFIYAYLIYAIAFVSATWLQLQLAGNPKWGNFVEDHTLVRFFLGGEQGFAKQILFSLVIGVLIGFLVVNIPLWAVLYASSEWVLALRGSDKVDRKAAMQSLRSLVLGIQYPWLIVENGEVTESKPKGLLPSIGGPGKAVIRPGHAVVFQRHGEITQIRGPGLITMGRHEEVRDIVQLKPMWHSDILENVLTKDRIPLRITFGVGFQIEPKSEVHIRTPDGELSDPVTSTPVLFDDAYMVYEGSIRKAVFDTASDWKATTFGFAENLLRDIVATYYFDQIFKKRDEPDDADGPGRFDPDDRTIREIEEEIFERHKKIAPSWGVHTRTVDIKIIELPDEAQEQMLEVWAARHESKEDLIKARSRGEALLIEARAGREAATQRASARIIEARATRDAIIERGYAEAEAYAEQFRRVLSSVPDQYIGIIIEQLAGRIGLDNMMQFLNAITGNRRLLGAQGRLAEPGTASPSEESAPPEDTEG
jgi:regulator of protease activity HflC (stomatin/prohibitin superfamily)